MSRNGEQWRPIRGWPYAVSNHGRVRRSEDGPGTYAGKIRKLGGASTAGPGGTRYQVVGLSANGESKTMRVHQLVLRAFVGPCPDGYEAHHVNAIREDNRLENLRYIRRKKNRTKRGEANPFSNLTVEDVLEIRRRHFEDGASYYQIAKERDMHRAYVRLVVIGERWSHV